MKRVMVVGECILRLENGKYEYRWCVVLKRDRTFILCHYQNLWDAGAKAAKLNAREDQPA